MEASAHKCDALAVNSKKELLIGVENVTTVNGSDPQTVDPQTLIQFLALLILPSWMISFCNRQKQIQLHIEPVPFILTLL